MKIIFKILSAICIAFFVVITFMFGQFPLMEGRHLIYPYIDTQFSKSYSPEKFEKIKIGMTIDEAYMIIGKPLHKRQGYIDTLNVCYDYTDDGKFKLLHPTKDYYDFKDFAWYRSTLEVDTANKIVHIDKGWSYD